MDDSSGGEDAFHSTSQAGTGPHNTNPSPHRIALAPSRGSDGSQGGMSVSRPRSSHVGGGSFTVDKGTFLFTVGLYFLT